MTEKWTKKEVVVYPEETFKTIIKKSPKNLKELTVYLI